MWYLHEQFAGDLVPLQLKGKVYIAFRWFMSLDPVKGTECPQVLWKQVGGRGTQCLQTWAYN